MSMSVLQLPIPHERESHLFPYFQRLNATSPELFGCLGVGRSSQKGRYLLTKNSYEVGDRIFEERAVVSVSDDATVCLACNIRHPADYRCASYRSYFSSMKSALSSVDSIADQSNHTAARITEVMKFVGLTYVEVFAPSRNKEGEEERKSKSPAWLLLGLDDGTAFIENQQAASSSSSSMAPTTVTVIPRPADPERSLAAHLIHNALPLTYRKHYPPALLETVLTVLDLNAHETSESAVGDDESAASSSSSVEGMSGDAVFPFFAMIEHACNENCCWTTRSEKVGPTAATSIMQISALHSVSPKLHAQQIYSSRMNFNFSMAMVRGLSPAFENSLKMSPPPVPIDVSLANKQHDTYMEVLAKLLPTVIEIPAESQYPDCNFIEDTAIIMNDVVVISRPGAATRLGEEQAILAELERRQLDYKKIFKITEPATMDGGDILFTGRHLFVGESKRTNAAATAQLRRFFDVTNGGVQVPFTVHPVPVTEGLHLKSIVSILADGVLVLAGGNGAADIVRQTILGIDPSYQFIVVPDIAASNVLRVRETLLIQKGFGSSETILRDSAKAHGLEVIALDMSELIKADGALTCGSLLTTQSVRHSPRFADAAANATADSYTPLSISYAPPYLPTSKRRSYLSSTYGFHCVCALCEGRSEQQAYDLARGFRCQQSRSNDEPAALCEGVVCPLGEGGSTRERWSCQSCGKMPDIGILRAYLAAESALEASLRGTAHDQLDADEDVFDALLTDVDFAKTLRPLIEEILANTEGSSRFDAVLTASFSSSSSPSDSTHSPSLSVSLQSGKTARKLLIQREQKRKVASASSSKPNGNGLPLSAQLQQLLVAFSPSHYMLHQLRESLLSILVPQAIATRPAANAATLWQQCVKLSQQRLASISFVTHGIHWSMARELDRLACLKVAAGDSSGAVTDFQHAHGLLLKLFGPQPDLTQRAKLRAENPPRDLTQLDWE